MADINPDARPNPGIDDQARALPDVQRGPMSPDHFQRELLQAGHQRQSPGDRATDPARSPVPRPRAASDVAREIGKVVPGSARTSPGNAPSRGPVSPEEALFGAAGQRFDYAQSREDESAQPVNGRGGRVDNRNDATPRPVDPSLTKDAGTWNGTWSPYGPNEQREETK